MGWMMLFPPSISQRQRQTTQEPQASRSNIQDFRPADTSARTGDPFPSRLLRKGYCKLEASSPKATLSLAGGFPFLWRHRENWRAKVKQEKTLFAFAPEPDGGPVCDFFLPVSITPGRPARVVADLTCRFLCRAWLDSWVSSVPFAIHVYFPISVGVVQAITLNSTSRLLAATICRVNCESIDGDSDSGGGDEMIEKPHIAGVKFCNMQAETSD
ncbi:hypothetical protein V8F06_012882 [Rhypophila decipiens]